MNAAKELEFVAMIDSFPLEISQDILFRLPPKCLIKCTLVCKSWRSLIKNRNFIRTHLSYNNRHGTPLLLLHCITRDSCHTYAYQVFLDEEREERYSLHYDNPTFDEYCKLEFPIFDVEKMCNPCFRVVGTCNGLVCLADDLGADGNIFVICNPLIRKLVTLPEPNVRMKSNVRYNVSIGFGFDANTNDYKVVRLVTLLYDHLGDPEKRTVAEVYSLAAGSWSGWRHVSRVSRMDACTPQAFVNGTLHWQAVCETHDASYHFILTFDLGSELFSEIMMPEISKPSPSNQQLQLSASGDGKSIALFWRVYGLYMEDRLLDIWVMKEYGVPESWTKLTTLWAVGSEQSLLPKALCFRKTGEVVLELVDEDVCHYFWLFTCPGHGLYSIDPVSTEFKYLGISGYKYYTIESYEESLVLLDMDNAVSY